MSEAAASVRALISGRVQGVGYRYWAQAEARRRGLDGWVRNRIDGRVEALFQGRPEAVEAMLMACRDGPMMARVTGVETRDQPAASAEPGFAVLPTA